MPIYMLNHELWFPAEEEYGGDIVAVGGDLSLERIITGYSMGIFPWYNVPGEIVWWCPEERCLINVNQLRISHSMRNELNKNRYRVTYDTCFREVMEGCRWGPREGETWILDEVLEAYCSLHEKGLCHSVEVWEGDALVGGLYGGSLGRMFFGESMFSKRPNASKVGLIHLARRLQALGWQWIDCQVYTEHLGSLGAQTMLRADFLHLLQIELKYPTWKGAWTENA